MNKKLQEEISKLPERVDRGIEWFAGLGFSLEDLEDEITPEIFNMQSCTTCMVGQVLGSYWNAAWNSVDEHAGEFLGFYAPMNLNNALSVEKYYRALELEWAKRLGFCTACLPKHKESK